MRSKSKLKQCCLFLTETLISQEASCQEKELVEFEQRPQQLSSEEGQTLNRRAYFEQLLYKTAATVAISGASSLVMPPRRSFAFEPPSSRWQAEVSLSERF